MEPGTKFCPEHPELKQRPFATECPICNRRLVVHGHTYPDGADIAPRFQADDVKPLEPTEEAIVLKRLAELDVVDDGPLTDEEMEPIVGAAKEIKKSHHKKAAEPPPAKSHHKGKY